MEVSSGSDVETDGPSDGLFDDGEGPDLGVATPVMSEAEEQVVVPVKAPPVGIQRLLECMPDRWFAINPEVSSLDHFKYEFCHTVTGERKELPRLTPADSCYEMDSIHDIPGLMIKGIWRSVEELFSYHITEATIDGCSFKEVRHTTQKSAPISVQALQNQHIQAG